MALCYDGVSQEYERASREYDNMAVVQRANRFSPAFPESFVLVGTNYGSPGRYTITKDLYNNRPVYEIEGTVWKVYFHTKASVVISKPPSDNWNTVNYWRGNILS